MLNRYGLVDGEKLLSERDEDTRSLERRWQADPSDQAAEMRFARAAEREDRLDDAARKGSSHAAHTYMKPHIERYEKAAGEAEKAQTAGTGERGTRLRTETRQAREEAAQNLHDHASDIGHHPGKFIAKREGETPYNHVHRLATLHGSHHYGTRHFDDGSHQVQYWRDPRVARQQADHLHKSIKHHYPHWESRVTDWAQGDSHRGKTAVRFTPGDEWHKPHQPTER